MAHVAVKPSFYFYEIRSIHITKGMN